MKTVMKKTTTTTTEEGFIVLPNFVSPESDANYSNSRTIFNINGTGQFTALCQSVSKTLHASDVGVHH